MTERHKIIYRNICTSAAENSFNIWWWKGREWERVSNKAHIPFHTNNKWIKVPSIYAEKTYVGVFPCSLIGKSHIGHKPEPTVRVAAPPHPPRTHTLIGWGVLYHFHFTVCDKWVKGERRVWLAECSNAVLFIMPRSRALCLKFHSN